MPCRNHPDEFSQPVEPILYDEGDELPVDETDQSILLWVIVSLVLYIRQTKQLFQLSEVDLTPLQNMLAFVFVPTNAHNYIV